MNDNNSADRLTVMSYCAELDMGRRIQAITRDGGVNIKKEGESFKFFFAQHMQLQSGLSLSELY